MALPERNIERGPGDDATQPAARSSWSAEIDNGYLPGGQVGQLHADLARRLAQENIVRDAEDSAGERLMRMLSRGGGYAALLAGYVAVAVLVLR